MQDAVDPMWPMHLLVNTRPLEVRCVQAKCWRDTPLPVGEVQRLLGLGEDWRNRFPSLASVLYVDLASWGELDPDAHVALKVGDCVRVREKWRPERMPDELFRAPRARRFTKPYRDKLGDWYEDVVARAYRDKGCEVFLRSRVCGKLHDGGVDLVCVRW